MINVHLMKASSVPKHAAMVICGVLSRVMGVTVVEISSSMPCDNMLHPLRYDPSQCMPQVTSAQFRTHPGELTSEI